MNSTNFSCVEHRTQMPTTEADVCLGPGLDREQQFSRVF